MRNLGVLVSAAALLATTGCVETMGSGYPSTSYGSGYGNGYYSQPTYYSQPSYSQPSYYSAARPRRLRDSDRDGIPDRYDRDKNGDGVPDKYQRRH